MVGADAYATNFLRKCQINCRGTAHRARKKRTGFHARPKRRSKKVQVITSKDNEFIKNIKKLKDKKYRDETRVYLVEGIKMLKEAILENAKIQTIVICDEDYKNNVIPEELNKEIQKYNCIYVSKKVFLHITEVTNPQGILAVVEKKNKESKINYNEDIIVILDGIQDPGNLGTILRTVDSVGLTQIITSKDTVDA